MADGGICTLLTLVSNEARHSWDTISGSFVNYTNL